jgi:DNA-directed RNA polymerase specialized sigma24 family protein
MVKLPEGTTLERLKQQINELIVGPKSQRDRAIMLAYLTGDYTYETLAEEFEVSVSTVQRVIDRGRGNIYE